MFDLFWITELAEPCVDCVVHLKFGEWHKWNWFMWFMLVFNSTTLGSLAIYIAILIKRGNYERTLD